MCGLPSCVADLDGFTTTSSTGFVSSSVTSSVITSSRVSDVVSVVLAIMYKQTHKRVICTIWANQALYGSARSML